MKRVFWRDFLKQHPNALDKLQKFLKVRGKRLEIVFDDSGKATDVFIQAEE